MSGISLEEASAFIWLEADVLDSHDYKTWLALWTAQGHYIIPTSRGATDYESRLNIAYDDQAMREARVKRLRSGFSMSSAPPARTIRTVSRFRVIEETETALTVRAAQVLIEYKYERTRTLAADVTYRLTHEKTGLKLDRKVVDLVNADDALHGIGYLL